MKIIAAYMRISIEDHKKRNESNSITNQRQLIYSFVNDRCEFEGCRIDEFADDGYSGQNFNRPAVLDLLQRIKKNKVDCVIVKDFSRFSRDYIEISTYLDQIFPFMGVRFISINDNYDSDQKEGISAEIDTAFKVLLYDFYSKDISVKMRSSIHSRYRDGSYKFSQAPFGYKKSEEFPGKIVINEKEAEIVTYIFSLAKEGLSTGQIAKKLYEEGVLTCSQMRKTCELSGEKKIGWSSQGVARILDNQFYIGNWICNKTMRLEPGGKKKKLHKKDWIVIENHHEPIIKSELFYNIRQNRKISYLPAKKGKSHLLAGILVCGGCGHSMSLKKVKESMEKGGFTCRKKTLWEIPACCSYISFWQLEKLIITALIQQLNILADENRLYDNLVEMRKKQVSRKKEETKKYNRLRTESDREKQKIYEYFVSGRCDTHHYREEVERIDRTLNQGKESLVRNKIFLKKVCKKRQEIFLNIGLTHLSQEMIDCFVKNVIVFEDKKIKIEWKFQSLY